MPDKHFFCSTSNTSLYRSKQIFFLIINKRVPIKNHDIYSNCLNRMSLFRSTSAIVFPLVSWYSGASVSGRVFGPLADFWSWDDNDLEFKHDYIQFVFPIMEASMFNSNAPVVTVDIAQELRTNLQCILNMKKSLNRMLLFYGFEAVPIDVGSVNNVSDSFISCALSESSANCDFAPFTRSVNFKQRFANWGNPGNHNHLRLTRIMRSLRIFGLYELSERLYSTLLVCVKQHPTMVHASTLPYWKDAKEYIPF